MTGHTSFSRLRKAMPPARRATNAGATKGVLRDVALAELRQAREKKALS